MDENQGKIALYIINRDSAVEARSLLKFDNEAEVLLVGRGIMLPIAQMFPKRKVYILRAEAEAMGVGDKSGENLEMIEPEAMVEIMLNRQIFCFS